MHETRLTSTACVMLLILNGLLRKEVEDKVTSKSKKTMIDYDYNSQEHRGNVNTGRQKGDVEKNDKLAQRQSPVKALPVGVLVL